MHFGTLRTLIRRAALPAIVLTVLLTMPRFASAQTEIHPYAGGFFPGTWADTAKFNKEGLYGVRAGMFVTKHAEVEGNFGYINHFLFKDTIDQGSRAVLWDVNGSYNFMPPQLKRAEPFVTFGLGGVTASIRGGGNQTVTLLDPGVINSGTLLEPPTLKGGNTFLALNYGGGIKGLRLWGPMGLRADVRGRSLPNFRDGRPLNWLEVTGGLTFSWGER